MEHIDKYQLEKLFLSPDDFSDNEKNEIKKHLELCVSCRDYAGKLRDFYTALEENIDSEPTKEDKSFAEKLLVKRRLALPIRGLEKRKIFDTYTEIIESYKRPVLQRFIRYIQYHPVKFAGAMTFSAIVLALAVFFFKPIKDTNPAYAKINNYVLSVYNKESQSLWKKSVIGIPDCSNDEKILMEGLTQVFLRVGDIDGDNIYEILIKGNSQHADFTEDTLYCFNNYGNLRWKTGYGKKIHFGELGKGQEGYEFIIDFIIIKLPKPRLFAIANIKGMAPSKLFEINTATGREMQAYHHRGGVLILDHWDFEKDGKEEILIAGLNDGLNHAFLAVLDPDNINGHAPTIPIYTPRDIPKATEKYYLMFPLTEIGKNFADAQYNIASHLDITKAGQIKIQIIENLAGRLQTELLKISVVYLLDSNLSVIGISFGDDFMKVHDMLLEKGKLKKSLFPDHKEDLKKQIQYWDGEKFVYDPTINNAYLRLKNLP